MLGFIGAMALIWAILNAIDWLSKPSVYVRKESDYSHWE